MIAVVERLSRQWIGINITYQSILLILKRLDDSFGRDFIQDTFNKKIQKIISISIYLS